MTPQAASTWPNPPPAGGAARTAGRARDAAAGAWSGLAAHSPGNAAPHARWPHGASARGAATGAGAMKVVWWIIVLAIVSIVAGVLGLSGVAAAAGGIASILFWALIIFGVVALVAGLVRRR